jgi:hypothetical protein
LEGASFDGHVGVDVGVCGSAVGVAEPQGDDGGVDSGVEQRHRAAVTQDVGVEFLGAHGLAAGRGDDGILADESLDGIGVKTPTGTGGEKGIVAAARAFLHPDLEHGFA